MYAWMYVCMYGALYHTVLFRTIVLVLEYATVSYRIVSLVLCCCVVVYMYIYIYYVYTQPAEQTKQSFGSVKKKDT